MTRLFLIAVPTIPHFKPPLLGGFFIYKTEPLVITTRGSLLIMFNLKIYSVFIFFIYFGFVRMLSNSEPCLHSPCSMTQIYY